jgi:hypothetical protein
VKVKYSAIFDLQAYADQSFNVPLHNDIHNMIANGWTVYLYSFDHANPDAFMEDNPVKSETAIFIIVIVCLQLIQVTRVVFRKNSINEIYLELNILQKHTISWKLRIYST